MLTQSQWYLTIHCTLFVFLFNCFHFIATQFDAFKATKINADKLKLDVFGPIAQSNYQVNDIVKTIARTGAGENKPPYIAVVTKVNGTSQGTFSYDIRNVLDNRTESNIPESLLIFEEMDSARGSRSSFSKGNTSCVL